MLLCSSTTVLAAPPQATPDELDAWDALAAQKFVRARELGEKLVAADPDGFAGHYILGAAFHYGEGDLARAEMHLEKSVALFERAHAPGTGPWRWHEAALKELAYVLDEIDRPDDELRVLDEYDRTYLPKRLAQRVWPLMKLHRYDEARRIGDECDRGTFWDKLIARTAICATEWEAGDRTRSYDECTRLLGDYWSVTATGEAIFLNTSLAAMSRFRFDEAERLLRESALRVGPLSWSNPWARLAELYTLEARIPEAVDALQRSNDLRQSKPARLDQHGQSELDRTVAAFLLAIGEGARAVTLAERGEAQPDRQGVHSGSMHQAASGAALLVAEAHRELAEILDERASDAPGLREALRLRAGAADERLEEWRAERRAATHLADEGLLVHTLRANFPGAAFVPEWLRPILVRVVGAGVVERAVALARLDEARWPAALAYLDAFEAEARLANGDDAEARALAERALAKLPTAERLLAGRTHALAAIAAERLGDGDAATQHFVAAMQHDPGVLRRLGVRLPVRVTTAGGGVADRAARLVEKSPRFAVRDDAAFTVDIAAGGDGVKACLLAPGNAVLHCSETSFADGAPVDELARRLMDDFHKGAFALKADLSQADLSSLDGSPTAARADKQVKSLVERLAP